MQVRDSSFDYDWIIVGSGFGGSVSALRLAEKGYEVAVLERGRRFTDDGFAKSTWDLRNWLWMPLLGLRGIFRLTPFKDVFIASGAGVGGGSLVYANTLYRAAPAFFDNPQWAGLTDWANALAPHYDVAERMLGVQHVPFESDGQRLQSAPLDAAAATPYGVVVRHQPRLGRVSAQGGSGHHRALEFPGISRARAADRITGGRQPGDDQDVRVHAAYH